MTAADSKYYREEKWNAITHALGLLFVLIGGGFMLYQSYVLDWPNYVAVVIYVLGALFVFASSTIYHVVPRSPLKEKLCQLDHISIYFMIAGSQMPLLMSYFNNQTGYIMMALLWSFVFIGVVFKLFYMSAPESISLAIYIAMGCVSLILLPQLVQLMPQNLLLLVFLGGAFYLVGIIFYLWESLPYNHPIWHLFVLAGCVTHFLAIYWVVF